MADRDRDLTDEEVLSELPNDIQQMISDGKLDRDDAIEEWREQAVWDDTAPAGLPTVSPHILWEQTGGGDAADLAEREWSCVWHNGVRTVCVSEEQARYLAEGSSTSRIEWRTKWQPDALAAGSVAPSDGDTA